MDPSRFTKVDPMTWQIEPTGAMRVPAIIYADEELIRGMDEKVGEQVCTSQCCGNSPGILCDAGCALGLWISDRRGRGLRRRERRCGFCWRRRVRHFLWRSHDAHGAQRSPRYCRNRRGLQMLSSTQFPPDLAVAVNNPR